jgi:hypothetical protein
MKLVYGYLFPFLVYHTCSAQDDMSREEQALLRRQPRPQQVRAGYVPAARTIRLPEERESSLRSSAVASKFKTNLWTLKQLAHNNPAERRKILIASKKLTHLRDGFGTFQGDFSGSYSKKLQKFPLTETLIRAIQERTELELTGLAPPPKSFAEYMDSTIVRTAADEGVCRVSNSGIVCENQSYRESDLGTGLIRRRKKKRRKKRRKNKKVDGTKATKPKRKKFGSWVDNGMGMMCNGYKCKPKPTRFPMPTTTKATADGQFNDKYGRISFDNLYKTLVELNQMHPLRNFKYLNLDGNYLVGDIAKLKEILCLMPQVESVSLKACGITGVLPSDTFTCVTNLVEAHFDENGFWCAKGAFNKALRISGFDDDGRPEWSLKTLSFEMNPMTSRCYLMRTGQKPYTIAKLWDFEAIRLSKRVTYNEWGDMLKACVNDEPNCETNRPSIDMMFFAK